VITNSIGATDLVKSTSRIKQLTVAPLIGEAIRRISEERSISALFK
jgi:ribose-phosphate pyrophosphokinase